MLTDSTRPFTDLHIGPRRPDIAIMCRTLGVADVDELIDQLVPAAIRSGASGAPLALPRAASEAEATAELAAIAGRNALLTPMIGTGWYGTRTPDVIRRAVLENPAWYTAYTPYQPEISQGRLQMLLAFQTMVADLTGTDVAGASLLDEATAAAEAMTLAHRSAKVRSDRFLADPGLHPHVLAVLATRAEPLGIELLVADPFVALADGTLTTVFGVLVAEPASDGSVRDHAEVFAAAHAAGAVTCAATDLLACVLMAPPGARGADVVVGSAQRFGVPLGFGGPHAGFLAVRSGMERTLPGRLVGVSRDAHGSPALRLALQTREQHIRREKATSNICTAQVLLAVMSAGYAIAHGPAGLRAIARRVHRCAEVLVHLLGDTTAATGASGSGASGSGTSNGAAVVNRTYFDTLTVRVADAERVLAAARAEGINLRRVDTLHVGISCDETTTVEHLAAVLRALGRSTTTTADVVAADALLDAALGAGDASDDSGALPTLPALPPALRRSTPVLAHPVFSSCGSETELLRLLRRHADADLALDRTMIPLGSCTMKLNAAAEMFPISWPHLADVHPLAPADQVSGYHELITQLEGWLCEITGYDRVHLAPNSGAQGEYAGLLAIRAHHRARGEQGRDVCLIPASAHGTNAASAALCGMRVVVVRCADNGDVDIDDLRERIDAHREQLAALMITYPSTHGVFEDRITDICALVHDAGGQVYLDGANLNALVGIARPGRFGADVSHLNLHKTFCIPHGGGGPGVGPVCVRAHLAPYLPGSDAVPAVTSAPYGSAGILAIPWMYIRMMGGAGLTAATKQAITSANYLATRLADAYPILYTGRSGRVAHECILDLRPLTQRSGITVDDVAKRLIDHGFHAPTMSFPVAGTLMVEPTESEPLTELDRFIDAMLAIRAEIQQVIDGAISADDSPLRHAPHTAAAVAADDWTHPYSRSAAAYPLGDLTARAGAGADAAPAKYWPPVGRIDGAYGDRNIMCSCPPVG